MILHHIDPENNLIEITISGKIKKEDISKIIKDVEGPIQQWSEIRILKRIDSFDGIELIALISDLKFAFNNLSNLKKIKKVAVVTDKDWVEKLTEWVSPLIAGEVEVFDNEDIEKARAWLI